MALGDDPTSPCDLANLADNRAAVVLQGPAAG